MHYHKGSAFFIATIFYIIEVIKNQQLTAGFLNKYIIYLEQSALLTLELQITTLNSLPLTLMPSDNVTG